MAVESSESQVSYDCDGSTTVFPVPFYFQLATDLTIQLLASDGTITPVTSGYEVAGAGSESGGSVTTDTAYASGRKIVVSRIVPITQEIRYQSNNTFPAKTQEKGYDKLTMIAQQHERSISRSIQFPDADISGASSVLPAAAARLGKAMVFDESTGAADTSSEAYVEPSVAADNAKHVAEELVAGVAPGSGTGTFIQDGTGATVRTFQSKQRDFVCVFDFMTAAQIADVKLRSLGLDVTAAVQAAVNAASHVYFPKGAYRIDGSVTHGSDLLCYGDGDTSTNIVNPNDVSAFIFDDGFHAGGSPAFQRIGFADMAFTCQGAASAIRFTGSMNVSLRKIRFIGGTGFQLQLEQVFDSYFENCYWASTTGTSAALAIRSGTADCSNNLRFKSCTWEQLSAGAIKSVTESGGLENYSYAFDDCKFERCNISGTATSWISMFPASGTRAHVSISFKNPIFALDDDATSFVFYGDTVSQVSFENVQVPGQVSHPNPLFSIKTTVLFTIDGLYMFLPGQSNTTYVPITNSGTNTVLSVSKVLLNNLVVYQAVQSAGTTVDHSVQNIQNPGGAYQQYTYPGLVTYSWTIEGAGALVARSTLLSGNIVYQVTAAGRFAVPYGITNQDSAWNGNLFRLGGYNFWVDGSGRLRIKNGVPASDTDGTIVGSQS